MAFCTCPNKTPDEPNMKKNSGWKEQGIKLIRGYICKYMHEQDDGKYIINSNQMSHIQIDAKYWQVICMWWK